MNTYLEIITTVLVITQVVRVTQNAIQLRRMNGEIKKKLEWIERNDISEEDFETQRTVFRLLRSYLTRKEMEKVCACRQNERY